MVGVSTGSQIRHGNYGGNDAVNRGIPHNFGTIPSHILIVADSGFIGQIGEHREGKIIYTDAALDGEYAVTTMDATNFYVGNASDYFRSMNAGGKEYQWVAWL